MKHIYMLDFRPLGGLLYIGITTNLRQRKHQHIYNARHGGMTDLHKAIRCFGMPEPRRLITVPAILAEKCEAVYIATYKTHGPMGYNMTPGGTQTPQELRAARPTQYVRLIATRRLITQ